MAANPSTQTLQEQLDTFLGHVRRETGVPGICAAVSLQGKRIHSSVGVLAQGGEHPMTKDTQFHLGCITKLFVSIVALELAWAKELDLTAPIGSYLPELADTVHGTTVNMGHLLSHTSGYRGTSILERDTFGWSWDNLVGYLRSAPQHFTPGTVFNYEHSEAVIAGEIVRRLTGKTAVEQIRGRLLDPRGVAVGTLDVNRHDPQLQAGQHLLDPATRKFKQVSFADLVEPGKKPTGMWESSFSRYSVSLD